MANTAAEPTGAAKTNSNGDKPTRTRRPRANAEEESNGARYFLATSNANGGSPALDREVASEGEALVEALRLGVTYYAIHEYRVVPDFAAKVPQLKKEAVHNE
jgi:hypothetical protein